MPQAEGHVRLGPRDQPGGRILAGRLRALLDRLPQLIEDPHDDGHDDGVPVREMGVDRRGGDADLAGYRAQRNRLVRAGPLDQGECPRHDVFRQPGALAASVPLPPARAGSGCRAGHYLGAGAPEY